jgi:hypothetical protein
LGFGFGFGLGFGSHGLPSNTTTGDPVSSWVALHCLGDG